MPVQPQLALHIKLPRFPLNDQGESYEISNEIVRMDFKRPDMPIQPRNQISKEEAKELLMSKSSKSLNSSDNSDKNSDGFNSNRHAAFFERAKKRKEEAKIANSLRSL